MPHRGCLPRDEDASTTKCHVSVKAMERRAKAAESLLARSSGQAALDYAIQAAELYMLAAAETTSKREAKLFRRKCEDLIAYGERLKSAHVTGKDLSASSSSSTSDASEHRLLQRTSRLHGNYFPPWTADPSPEEFNLSSGAGPFTDDADLVLSPKQVTTFDDWKRPRELFSMSQQSQFQDEIFMNSGDGCDLVQDMTTDCSVVASLCAAMRILTGSHQALASIFYPFDHTSGRPAFSASGKYIFRLHFNGCYRSVVIDERLPASLTDRTLFVVDRRNPHLIWPALLEKAYLKVRGGYDFPGSNSGTDLWVLTGWIPEQLFLQREDLDIDATWDRVKAAHDTEDVVVTLGTGRISLEEEDVLGLIGEHDYAVMNLDDEGDTRKLLVKNPWCNGPTWKGGGSLPAAASALHGEAHEDKEQTLVADGSFWMTLEDVVQNFESMYLNWNPKKFSHRQDHHLSWTIPTKTLASSLVCNPQYSMRCQKGGTIWILVSRHFVDAELEIARTRTESMAAVSRQLGFMSVLIFENDGNRVQVGDGAIYRGPYVDSPQTLARFNAKPGKQYTIVLDQHEFPLPEYTLTLSLFSQHPLQVQEAKDAMAYCEEMTGVWNRRNAGGNASCPTYSTNPQFRLSIDQASPLSILLSTDNPDIPIHVDLLWAQGKRATSVRVRDLAGSSGEYRRGCAVANVPQLDPGEYTVVCSTFDAGQIASFALRVASMTPVVLQTVPMDAAGRLRTPLPPLKLMQGEEVRRIRLSASWLTRASATVRSIIPSGSEPSGRDLSALMLRLSIVHGTGPEQATIAISGDGEYQEPRNMVRTPDFDAEPGRIQKEGMWLLVESMGAHKGSYQVEVELHSDAPVHVGDWEVL